ncbi:MAG: WYL domain-containing protein [Bacteroidota bacterium]
MDIQKRLLRVFHLIRLLNSPPSRTVASLTKRLGTSQSELYRLLQLLKEIGYPVTKDDQNRYSLDFSFPKQDKAVLTSDELNFLQAHLQQTAASSPLAQNILHKFDLNLSLIPLADALPQLHASRIIQMIRIGIDLQSCVKLHGYRSLTSNRVANRKVEPLEITEDYRYLIAWDLDKDDQRQFKINRIEDVSLLDDPVQPGRMASPMDLFGLTGDEWTMVRMRLSNTAHHLLVEEFPLSRQYIRLQAGQPLFEGQVRNWKGIGRFVLGLPGEIEVIEPEAFRQYLQEKKAKW